MKQRMTTKPIAKNNKPKTRYYFRLSGCFVLCWFLCAAIPNKNKTNQSHSENKIPEKKKKLTQKKEKKPEQKKSPQPSNPSTKKSPSNTHTDNKNNKNNKNEKDEKDDKVDKVDKKIGKNNNDKKNNETKNDTINDKTNDKINDKKDANAKKQNINKGNIDKKIAIAQRHWQNRQQEQALKILLPIWRQSQANETTLDIRVPLAIAQIYRQSGILPQAILWYNRVIAIQPHHAESLFYLAKFHNDKDLWVAALRALEKTTNLDMEKFRGEIHYHLAMLYKTNNPKKSQHHLRQSAEASPPYVRSLIVLLNAAIQAQSWNQAAYYLEKLEYQYSHDMASVIDWIEQRQLLEYKAKVYHHLGQSKASAVAHQEILKLDFQSKLSHLYLARFFHHQKQWQQSNEHYSYLKKNNFSFPAKDLKLYAQTLDQTGQQNQAAQTYKKLLDLPPSSSYSLYFIEAFEYLASHALKQVDTTKKNSAQNEVQIKQIQLALLYLKKLHRLYASDSTNSPQNQQLVSQKAAQICKWNLYQSQLYQQSEQYQQARQALLQCLKYSAKNQQALDSLRELDIRTAKAAFDKKQYLKAHNLFTQFLTKYPNDQEAVSKNQQSLFLAASGEMEKKQYQQALPLFIQYQKQFGNDPPTLHPVQKNKKNSDSKTIVEKNIDICRLKIGENYYKNKHWQKMREHFTHYLKHNPNDTKIYLKIAESWHHEKQIIHEEKTLLKILSIEPQNEAALVAAIKLYSEKIQNNERLRIYLRRILLHYPDHAHKQHFQKLLSEIAG